MTDSLKKDIKRASNTNSLVLLLSVIPVSIFLIFREPITELIVGKDSINFSNVRSLISSLFQYIIAIPVSIMIFRLSKNGRSAPKLSESFCKAQATAKQLVRWIFISLFFIYASGYLSNFLYSAIQKLSGVELHPINMSADSTLLGRLTNIIAMMFLAPLLEEIFFRATMLRNAGRYGTWSMIIAMSIIFGLWHRNYAQTLYTAVLGICAGFLIIKTKSILPSILLHLIMNTIGTVQSIFSGQIDVKKLSAGDVGYITDNVAPILVVSFIGFLLMGIMVTGLVLFILEVINHKDTFRLENDNTEISEKKKFVLYFTAPITIVTMLIFIAETVLNAIIP